MFQVISVVFLNMYITLHIFSLYNTRLYEYSSPKFIVQYVIQFLFLFVLASECETDVSECLSVTSPLLCITHFQIKKLFVCFTPISFSFTLKLIGYMSSKFILCSSFFGPRLQQKGIIKLW
jgi:hypothetical protein